jgi:hypothetical protein
MDHSLIDKSVHPAQSYGTAAGTEGGGEEQWDVPIEGDSEVIIF